MPRSEAARSCAERFGGGGLPRVVAEPTREPAAPGRTEICWRRVLPGTDGSTVAGVGRKYMRGCSGRRLAPAERVGSRERAGAASTAGRIPEVLPSLRGYDEMTGSCTSADAAPETESPVCGSLEVFAPPSVLPKILVRSPNVEFPYLKSVPRDRLSQCPSTVPVSCRSMPSSSHQPMLGVLSVQAIKSPSPTSREGLDRTRIALFRCHAGAQPLFSAFARAPQPAVFRFRAGAPTRCFPLSRGRPNPLFWLERSAQAGSSSLPRWRPKPARRASNANGVAQKRQETSSKWGALPARKQSPERSAKQPTNRRARVHATASPYSFAS
jgi:hypothetical protein